jgi:hypothetical protein
MSETFGRAGARDRAVIRPCQLFVAWLNPVFSGPPFELDVPQFEAGPAVWRGPISQSPRLSAPFPATAPVLA